MPSRVRISRDNDVLMHVVVAVVVVSVVVVAVVVVAVVVVVVADELENDFRSIGDRTLARK